MQAQKFATSMILEPVTLTINISSSCILVRYSVSNKEWKEIILMYTVIPASVELPPKVSGKHCKKSRP